MKLKIQSNTYVNGNLTILGNVITICSNQKKWNELDCNTLNNIYQDAEIKTDLYIAQNISSIPNSKTFLISQEKNILLKKNNILQVNGKFKSKKWIFLY